MLDPRNIVRVLCYHQCPQFASISLISKELNKKCSEITNFRYKEPKNKARDLKALESKSINKQKKNQTSVCLHLITAAM